MDELQLQLLKAKLAALLVKQNAQPARALVATVPIDPKNGSDINAPILVVRVWLIRWLHYEFTVLDTRVPQVSAVYIRRPDQRKVCLPKLSTISC